MTSLQTSFRQVSVNAPNFVVLVSNTTAGDRLRYVADTTGFGANVTGSFVTETNIADSNVTAGTLLRDMGVSVVSSGLTFRKVQYVLPGSGASDAATANKTNGVLQAATADSPYKTFYIQLGANGGTSGVKVARV